MVSLKGRLPQKLQSKSTLSCEVVQIHSLFRHGFIKKRNQNLTELENRRILFLYDGFRKNRSWYLFHCKCPSRVDTKHKIILDILFIYFLFHHHLFEKRKGAYSCLPSKDSLNYSLALFKGWFHLWSFCSVKKCFLFVYMYIDLIKFKANKLFENSDADLPWLLF